jgi:hypothetical protein
MIANVPLWDLWDSDILAATVQIHDDFVVTRLPLNSLSGLFCHPTVANDTGAARNEGFGAVMIFTISLAAIP